MAKNNLDFNDSVVSPFFVLSATIAVGLVDMSLFGVDFAGTVFAIGSHADISIAKLISLMALAVAFATNKPDFDALGFVETWVAIVTVGLVVLPPFMPMLDWLLGHSIAGLVAVVLQAAGFYTLAYLG